MDVRSDFSDTISVWVDGLDLNGLTRGVCVCVCVCYQVNTIVTGCAKVCDKQRTTRVSVLFEENETFFTLSLLILFLSSYSS